MTDRHLRFTEIIRAGDYVEWAPDAWTKIEVGSPYIGQMVAEACEEEDESLRFKRIHEPVYVFTIFIDMPLVGWCCDRKYEYIDDMSWRTVQMGDIIEVDDGIMESQSIDWCPPSYFSAPPWAVARIKKGDRYVTKWTNYYECHQWQSKLNGGEMISTKYWDLYYEDALILKVRTKDGREFTQRKRLPNNASQLDRAVQQEYAVSTVKAIKYLRGVMGWSIGESLRYLKKLRRSDSQTWKKCTHYEEVCGHHRLVAAKKEDEDGE